MIRYILVDDDPQTLKRVREKIDIVAKDYALQHVKSYDSSRKAFEAILKEKILGKVNNQKPYEKGDLVMLAISKNKNIGIYPEEIYFISSALISSGHKIIDNKKVKAEKPQSNHVHFYGKNDKIEFESIRITINDLELILYKFGFRKINQSTLINTNYIRNIDSRNLELYYCKTPFEISNKEKTRFLENI